MYVTSIAGVAVVVLPGVIASIVVAITRLVHCYIWFFGYLPPILFNSAAQPSEAHGNNLDIVDGAETDRRKVLIITNIYIIYMLQ